MLPFLGNEKGIPADLSSERREDDNSINFELVVTKAIVHTNSVSAVPELLAQRKRRLLPSAGQLDRIEHAGKLFFLLKML